MQTQNLPPSILLKNKFLHDLRNSYVCCNLDMKTSNYTVIWKTNKNLSLSLSLGLLFPHSVLSSRVVSTESENNSVEHSSVA